MDNAPFELVLLAMTPSSARTTYALIPVEASISNIWGWSASACAKPSAAIPRW